jgi:Flp pilus assembly protein TadB
MPGLKRGLTMQIVEDSLVTVGILLLVGGVSSWSIPAGCIVAGVILAALGLALGRSRARSSREPVRRQ